MLQRSHPNPNYQMSHLIFPPLLFPLCCLLPLLSHLMLHFLLPLLMAMLLFLLLHLYTTQLLSATCFCASRPIKLGTAHSTSHHHHLLHMVLHLRISVITMASTLHPKLSLINLVITWHLSPRAVWEGWFQASWMELGPQSIQEVQMWPEISWHLTWYKIIYYLVVYTLIPLYIAVDTYGLMALYIHLIYQYLYAVFLTLLGTTNTLINKYSFHCNDVKC